MGKLHAGLADAVGRLDTFTRGLMDDPDFESYPRRLAEETGRIRNEIGGTIPDGDHGELFENAFELMSRNAATRIRGVATERLVIGNRLGLNKSLGTYAALVAGSTDPVTIHFAPNKGLEAVDIQVAAGIIDKAGAARRRSGRFIPTRPPHPATTPNQMCKGEQRMADDIEIDDGNGGDPPAGVDVSKAPESGGQPTGDWREGVPADLRKMADRFASPADAVKAAADMRQKLGRSITPPADGASEDEWNAFYGKLGRPETPDGYKISRPEALPSELVPDERGQVRESAFLDAMHKAGAPPRAVQAAIDWYYNELTDLHGEMKSSQNTVFEQANATLRKEWGGEFDKNLELARRAFTAFGGADLAEATDAYKLSNHPAFLRAFARIGRQMGEDDMITGSSYGNSNADLQKRADELLKKDDYWTNEDVQREMREVMEQLHGTEPINPVDRTPGR